MNEKTNQEIVKQYYEIFFQGGEVPFEEFFAPEFTDHNGYPGQSTGPEGVRKGYETFRKSFTVDRAELADIIAQDDKVVVRTMVSGRQQENYFDMSRTAKTIDIEAISIFRISGKKIQERWGLTTMKERDT